MGFGRSSSPPANRPRKRGEGVQSQLVTTDLDTLATALHVKTDDLLKAVPHLAPWRPQAGITPKPSDAELVTLAVMQALLGFVSEARWLRHCHAHLRHLFPYLPQQSGYNKRLRRAAGLIRQVIRELATDTALWSDDVWIVDSTPVECGRSRETTKRSDLAGWAEYGYCASHSRYRVYSQCTGLQPGGEANLWPALTSPVYTDPHCSPQPASERPVLLLE